jgi:hypothetical protein
MTLQTNFVEIKKGDRVQIEGSKLSRHNTTGIVISVQCYAKGPQGPWEYGIEFTSDKTGQYEYWKGWLDNGLVQLVEE